MIIESDIKEKVRLCWKKEQSIYEFRKSIYPHIGKYLIGEEYNKPINVYLSDVTEVGKSGFMAMTGFTFCISRKEKSGCTISFNIGVFITEQLLNKHPNSSRVWSAEYEPYFDIE